MISAVNFAQALADRVQAVVPDGFTVMAEDGAVRVSHGDEYGTSTGVAEITGGIRERTAWAASALLSSVQDYVSEELRVPWPSLALPDAVLEGSRLIMWFGDRSNPVLTLAVIDLTALW